MILAISGSLRRDSLNCAALRAADAAARSGVAVEIDDSVSEHAVPLHPSMLDAGEIRERRAVNGLLHVVETLAIRAALLRSR